MGPRSCLSLGGYSDHRLEKWQVAPGGALSRLFPPQFQQYHLLPFPLPAALAPLWHVSLSDTVAWDGERQRVSHQLTGWPVFPSLLLPSLSAVCRGGCGLGRANCPELPLGAGTRLGRGHRTEALGPPAGADLSLGSPVIRGSDSVPSRGLLPGTQGGALLPSQHVRLQPRAWGRGQLPALGSEGEGRERCTSLPDTAVCTEKLGCLLLAGTAFPVRRVGLWMAPCVPCRPLTSCCCCGPMHCTASACPRRTGSCGSALTASVTTCMCAPASFPTATASPVSPGSGTVGSQGSWVEPGGLHPEGGLV